MKDWGKLRRTHKTNFLVHLINFSITNVLVQKEMGYKESFELYKLGVKDQLFIINGRMRDIEFLNIGMIGFGLRELEWTEEFIQNHQQYLAEEVSFFLVPLIYAYKANFQNNYESLAAASCKFFMHIFNWNTYMCSMRKL